LGGEGSRLARGKPIYMRHLPAAEIIRRAGFLLAAISKSEGCPGCNLPGCL
jgi:hypothetical protein